MIQVRCFDITNLRSGDYDNLYKEASPERQARADRYLKQEDRVRCMVAEAMMRLVPGYHVDDLAYTKIGKPYFKDPQKPHFNLSHSGRWVAVAWGDCPLGIDVEQFRMQKGKEAIARRFYRSDEQEYVFSAMGEERTERFFRIWTMKESYLKYLGTGITKSLDSFSVLGDPLGVTFTTELLPDACLSFCARDAADYHIQFLSNCDIR